MTDSQLKLSQLRQYQAMPLSAKVRLSEVRIREWYEAFDGMVYVAFSGGKDSTVLLDLVWSLYPNVPAVFADTGNELESVLEFVRSYEDRVVWVKPKMTFEQVVEKYGYPVISKRISDYVNRLRRTKSAQVVRRLTKGQNADGSPSPMSKIPSKWQFLKDAPFDVTNKCCGHLKFRPTSEYANTTGRKAITGVMASESNQRLNSYLNRGGCNAFDQSDKTSRPIMFWVEQDVLQYITERGLPIASAYGDITETEGLLKCSGEHRTGCKFCLFGIQFDKGENRIQRLARIEPESYRHAIEDLHYDEVMDYLCIDWKPVSPVHMQEQSCFDLSDRLAGRMNDGERQERE